MANAFYTRFPEALAEGLIDWQSSAFTVVLLSNAYTFSAAHTSFADVPVGARVAISAPLGNKTHVGGVLDADDVTFLGVTGAMVVAMALYMDTGTEATSPLLAFWDTAAGIPFTPSAANVTVQWDAGASKIMAL